MTQKIKIDIYRIQKNSQAFLQKYIIDCKKNINKVKKIYLFNV